MPPSLLTPAYDRLLRPEFGDTFQDQPRSTCSNCAMCRPAEPPMEGIPLYDPVLKCCTFHPDLPNFLLGRILADPEQQEGAERIRARIRAHHCTPWGLEASPAYERLYRSGTQHFGANPLLRCPFYDAGRCTIWKHRNGVCQTYFCKIEGGLPGEQRINQLNQFLYGIEHSLSLHLTDRLMHSPAGHARALGPQGQRRSTALRTMQGWIAEEGDIADDLYADLWGDYCGREEDYFRACADLADGLSPAEILAIGGPTLRAQRAVLHAASSSPPPSLRWAHIGVELAFEEQPTGMAVAHLRRKIDPTLISFTDWEQVGSEIHTLSPELRQKFWELGLLLEPSPGPSTPLSPTDSLRLAPHLKLRGRVTRTDDGGPAYTLHAGYAEFCFEEPELLEFGPALVARSSGFVAADLATEALPVARVLDLLQSLVDMGVLQRMGSGAG